MKQQEMEKIVKSIADEANGDNGYVEFMYKQVNMYLISDVTHNRMRIIAPIAKYEELKREHIDEALEANFHNALDARYATSNGILYSAYIHPLSSLTEEQVRSAVSQVANLALSFGNHYSSGLLTFGNNEDAVH